MINLAKKEGWSFHTIILDQHTVHQSKSTVAFLKKNDIKTKYVPPRSPDLMPLDFSVWKQVERKFFSSKVKAESESQFQSRLQSCARRVKKAVLEKITKNLKARCELCIGAGGKVFDENRI